MKTYYFLCFWIVAHLVNAQECSEAIKFRVHSTRYITLYSNNEFVGLAQIDSDNEIDELSTISVASSTLATNERLPKGIFYAGHCSHGNNNRLFFYQPDKSNSFKLFCININAGATEETPIEIATLHCERKQLPKYIHAIEDAQGIHICIPSYNIGKSNSAIQLLSLDKSLRPVRAKNLTLPYGDNTLETLQILPDSIGNLFILSKQLQFSRSKNLPARHFLFYYNFQRNALKEYDLQVQGKNISGAYLTLTANREVIVGGFYSNDMTMHTAGVFHTTIKPFGGSMAAIKTEPFDETDMHLFLDQRSKNIVVPDLELDGIVCDDNGISLWGERRYSTEHSGIDPLTGRVYNEIRHHNDQIVFARIDTSGILQFNTIIHKQQVTSSEAQYMSYHSYHNNNAFYFAFNDHPSNMGKSRDGSNIWHSSKTFISVCAEISRTAEVIYSPYENTDDSRIIPRLCNEKMIIRGKDKSIRFCRVK